MTSSSIEGRDSRYVQGGDTEKYENRLGWWERDLDTIQQSTDDVFVVIGPDYDRRPDKMATDMFGRPTMMWMILQYNSIVDINEEFRSGKRIRVPEPSRAQLTFLNKPTGGVSPANDT